MAKYQKKLHIFNSHVVLSKTNFSGVAENDFELITGSRLVWALSISSIDPGATVLVQIENGFSADFPFEEILTITGNAVGFFKKVLTDVHNLFDVKITVVGGNATFALGVSISDNALTTRIENAEIDVDLNHITQANGHYDSTRIGNGVYEMDVNPDGSIDVNIVDSASGNRRQLDPVFNEITNIPRNILTELVNYTVPLNNRYFLQRINVGGANVATYQLERFGNVQERVRTYFGAPLTTQMNFDGYSEDGLELTPGEIIRVKVEHYRPDNGDFEGRIQLLEIA